MYILFSLNICWAIIDPTFFNKLFKAASQLALCGRRSPEVIDGRAEAFFRCLIWMCVWQQDTRTHSLCTFTYVCMYVYSQYSIFFVDGFKKNSPKQTVYTLSICTYYAVCVLLFHYANEHVLHVSNLNCSYCKCSSYLLCSSLWCIVRCLQ